MNSFLLAQPNPGLVEVNLMKYKVCICVLLCFIQMKFLLKKLKKLKKWNKDVLGGKLKLKPDKEKLGQK